MRTKGTRPKGSGIPAKGRGYGGPANGEGNRGEKLIGRPTREASEVIRMAKTERIEALKDHLIGLALTAEREADQITATLGFLKHEDDKAAPVRNEVLIRTNVDRTLDR